MKLDFFDKHMQSYTKKIILALTFLLTLLTFVTLGVKPVTAQDPLPVCNSNGTIQQDTIWTPDCIYLVDDYLTVAQSTTLTIQAGTIVKVGSNKLIDIQGILKAEGRSDQSVIFTSLKDDTIGGDTNNDGDTSQPVPGDWGHINFADSSNDSESIIEHAIFRYGGFHKDYSQHGYHGCYNEEDWYYNDPSACNTIPYKGTIRLNKASPTIRNNEILSGTGYAISMDVDSEPTTSGNTLTNNEGNAIEIREGTVTGAVVRTWANTDMVYVMTGYLTYEPDTTLVIQPGVKVKVELNKLIDIQGILKVQGTSDQSVIFTSLKDDTIGGDTNNDGDTSQPAPGDWGYINFADSSNDAESIIEHAIFRYGGFHKDYSQHGNPGCYNEEDWYYYDPGVCNTIPYKGTIRLNKASPTIRNNEILSGTGYAISMDVDSEPTTSGNTLTGNEGNAIEIREGTITGAVVRTWENTDMVYVVTGYLTYELGTTLVIQPEVKVKVESNKLIDIQGILKVQGTSEQSVIFTSLKDDTIGGDTNNDGGASQPAPGDWGHINFADSSNDAKSIIEHAIFRYGGFHKDYSQHGYHGCDNEEDWYYNDPSACNTIPYKDTIRLNRASPAIRNNKILSGTGYAISMDVDSEPTISGNTLAGNEGNAIEIRDGFTTLLGLETNNMNNIQHILINGGKLKLDDVSISGTAESKPYASTMPIKAWANISYTASIPNGTNLTVSVLDNNGAVLKSNVEAGQSLADIDPITYPSLRLRVEMSTTSGISPELYDWNITATEEPTWLIKVVDENNKPMSDAIVYASGQFLGATNGAGLLNSNSPILETGTPLVALAKQAEQATVRDAHDGWAYRTYITNLAWNADGSEVKSFVIEKPGEQRLVVRRDSPLVFFNLIVSIDWDASDEYFEMMEDAFQKASDFLFDVTDGQMAFGQVAIYDNGKHWLDADYQLLATNVVRPHAFVGGINAVTQTHIIRLGRNWDGISSSSGNWNEPEGYRTMVHLFGHYALYLHDEYFLRLFDGDGNEIGQVDAACTGFFLQEIPANDATNASIMYHQYTASELADSDRWNEYCQNTEQHRINGKSDWETVVDHYSGSGWTINTPSSRGTVMAGPDEFPKHLLPFPEVTTHNSGVADNSPLQITVKDPQGQAVSNVLVALYVTTTDGTIALDQGLSNQNGRITIYGAVPGNQIKAATFDGALAGSILVIDKTSYELTLSPTSSDGLDVQPKSSPYLSLIPSADGDTLILQIHGVSGGSNLTGVIFPATGGGAAQTTPLVYSSEEGIYEGSLSSAGIGSGKGTVLVDDISGNQVISIIINYHLQQISAITTNTIYSEDGNFELYISSDAVPADAYATVVSVNNIPGPLPEGKKVVGNAYEVRFSGALTVLEKEGLLRMHHAPGLENNSIAIYYWDPAVQVWKETRSVASEIDNALLIPISRLGMYALIADVDEVEYKPALEIDTDGPSIVNVNDTIVLTLTVSHADSSDGSFVSKVTVTDDVAGPQTLVDGDVNSNNKLDMDEVWIYTANYTIPPTALDTLVHTATVMGQDIDGDPIIHTDKHNFVIKEDAPALGINKSNPTDTPNAACRFYRFYGFNTPEGDWTEDYDGINTNHGYIDGEFQILAKNPNRTHLAWPRGRYENYNISTWVRWFDSSSIGKKYGLTFGIADDLSSFYIFSVHPETQEYEIQYYNGAWHVLYFGNSSAINTGLSSNYLSVERSNDKINVAVNQTSLASITSTHIVEQRHIGVGVGPYTPTKDTQVADARFDNYQICSLVPVDGQSGETTLDLELTNKPIEYNPTLDSNITGPTTAEVDETIIYTFTVNHAKTSDGSPVSEITLSDRISSVITLVDGDSNGNNRLDADETWVYTASHTIQSTDPNPLVNAGTVKGKYQNNKEVIDFSVHGIDIQKIPAPDVDKSSASATDESSTLTYNNSTWIIFLMSALVGLAIFVGYSWWQPRQILQMLPQIAASPETVYRLLYTNKYRLFKNRILVLLAETLESIDSTASEVILAFLELRQSQEKNQEWALKNWMRALHQREETRPSELGRSLLTFQNMLKTFRTISLSEIGQTNFDVRKQGANVTFLYEEDNFNLEASFLKPDTLNSLLTLDNAVNKIQGYSTEIKPQVTLNLLDQSLTLLKQIEQQIIPLSEPEAVAIRALTTHWLELLPQEQQRKQQEMIRSVYIAGRPITEPHLFFGRKEEMRRSLNAVQEDSIMLYGIRRIGKTTVLHQLGSRLESQPIAGYWFVPVFINLQAVSKDELFSTLSEATRKQVEQNSITISELRLDSKIPNQYTDLDCQHDISEIIKTLKSRWPNYKVRPIWLLDEVDPLLDNDQLLQVKLRTIVQYPSISPYLRFVLAGVQPLKDLGDYGSPFYNMFTNVELTSLTSEDARKLIVEPVHEQYTYTEDAVDLIIRTSRAEPYWIQFLCRETLAIVAVQERWQITVEDVKTALKNMPPEFPCDE